MHTILHFSRATRSKQGFNSDTGSATLFGTIILMAIFMVFIGYLEYCLAIVTRHKTEAAADLAALAGGQKFYLGTTSACALSALIANDGLVGLFV